MRVNTSAVSQITPHVWIGDWTASNDARLLAEHNIAAVLTAERRPKSPAERAQYAKMGIEHLQIFVDDVPSERIDQYFDSTYNFIERFVQRGQNVLVHCAAGVSRSVTLVVNWLLSNWYQGRIPRATGEPEDALNAVLSIVRAGRPVANPNPGFVDQLYEAAKRYNAARKIDLSELEPHSNPAMSAPDPRSAPRVVRSQHHLSHERGLRPAG